MILCVPNVYISFLKCTSNRKKNHVTKIDEFLGFPSMLKLYKCTCTKCTKLKQNELTYFCSPSLDDNKLKHRGCHEYCIPSGVYEYFYA